MLGKADAMIGQSICIEVTNRRDVAADMGAAIEADETDCRLGCRMAASLAYDHGSGAVVVEAEMRKLITALWTD